MDRAASLLKLLALATAVAGGVCFYLVYRPADAGDWLAALRHFLPSAVLHPVVLGAAATAILASLGAQWHDRIPPLERGHDDVHTIDAAPPPPPSAPILTDERRGRTSRHERERWRSWLETPLRGKGDVPAFVDAVLTAAVTARASDVHLQPLEHETRVSLRIGGELEEVATAPQAHHEAIVRRLKVLARLVTYQTDRPQDGRITLAAPGGVVDLRLSAVPTRHGEKVVLRLARGADELLDLPSLGMPPALGRRFAQLLAEPQGMLVLTGPTGSGKTTTIYAALAQIHQSRGDTASIATLEDPVEIDLPFLNQTQVDHGRGLTFPDGLRAVLRQDPNVLMVGEIRDRETAQTAVQAGLTGHLILTTLHAGSAAGVFNRLIDLGVEPFLASSAVIAGVSQRLVRCLCRDCRQPMPITRHRAHELAEKGIAVDGLTFQTAAGCATCDGTGLQGRKAIFELLPTTPALRQLITAKATTDKVAELAAREGMTPLLKVAVAEAAAGNVSLDEALRVAG